MCLRKLYLLGIVGILQRHEKNLQAHGYRCSFHPRVFHGIVSTEECEYAIYGFRLIQGHTRQCGEDRRENFLYLESMPGRRDHVAVILRVKGIDQLIQADSSNMMLYPISERGGLQGLEQGCHHLPATSTNRGTIEQLSGIVKPRHVYAFPY